MCRGVYTVSYRYGITSKTRLESCHPDLQKIFEVAIQYTDISILCGHRTEKEQDTAFRANTTKVLWPNSKHNSQPSMAVDAAPYPIDWNDKKAFTILAGRIFQIADELYSLGLIDHKVKWGGDFNGFFDGPHFELYKPGE